jgi:hypothetical protein
LLSEHTEAVLGGVCGYERTEPLRAAGVAGRVSERMAEHDVERCGG